MCLPEYTKLTVFRANTQVRPYRVSREQNFEFLSFNFNFYIDIHSGPDSIPYLLLTQKEYLGQFSGRKAHTIGRYAVVLFLKKKN